MLGYTKEELQKIRGVDTASEICQQPQLWLKIWQLIVDQKKELESFLEEAVQNSQNIILTGAGTSAYIGLSLEGIFRNKTGVITKSISTTHLVSHPKDYFSSETPVLLISFARSGNSPESNATVELADKHCLKCYHLIITCNADGELANHTTKGKKHLILLPNESNDKSLAMTSSYTGMLLAGLLTARIKEILSLEAKVKTLAHYGDIILNKFHYKIKEAASYNFNRAVFLGSGPLYGTAKESHLKLQELTDGKIICKHDSFLGFRHGPKAVIDNSTLVVYLLSNSDYVTKYEKDLIKSMDKGKKSMLQIGIMEKPLVDIELDMAIVLNSKALLDEEMLTICSIILAQVLGFYKAVELGLSPDNPSESGAISRVVEGVTIYNN
ncbi:tagatose-6-phosphate ketose/aldose isomerase [Reichenbachiella faecimaris]|uniref:Tagatose-6-phosphate ketose/aldose isomerase n=1 Tax=Reichenbachiella faecimaris TaxID=692418 RepID=A0A1W2G8K8_REIFA|nr:SIS domain-containing protein [Reichenbachiella faecimaris]SMD32834.1 tagatose-6-phosphate ketose/aldose isomerase [Reichenbachiella faecimaris]